MILPDMGSQEELQVICNYLKVLRESGIDLSKCVREPMITQLHALCVTLTNKFTYKSHQLLEGMQKLRSLASWNFNANDQFSGETILQSLHQSVQTSGAASKPCADSVTGTGEVSEEELLRHPLGCFALPAASFHALVEVLGYLVSLGETECNRQICQLLPIAFGTSPSLFSVNDGVPSIDMPSTNNDTPRISTNPNRWRQLQLIARVDETRKCFRMVSSFHGFLVSLNGNGE